MASRKRNLPGQFKYDDDEDYVPRSAVKYTKRDNDSEPAKPKTHTLDSDEEDDDTNCIGEKTSYDVLQEKDIKGVD